MGPFIIVTMPADNESEGGGKIAIHHSSVVVIEDIDGDWREIVLRIGNEVRLQAAAEPLEEILAMLQKARLSEVTEFVAQVEAE